MTRATELIKNGWNYEGSFPISPPKPFIDFAFNSHDIGIAESLETEKSC